jgi:catechol 2,3-dioxygenase-like lactoylglutathione lyase family enzyme
MPTLTRSAPYFPVPDVDATASYYERVLGFTTEYAAGSPALFAIVSRDGLPIMLRRLDAPDGIRPMEAQGGTWDAFIWVREVRRLHDELSAKGADVVYGPIVQESYGMVEFAIRDPDGHVLGFGEPVETAGT